LGAGETAKNKSRDREEPTNAQFHGVLPTADRGPPPARTADPSILIEFMWTACAPQRLIGDMIAVARGYDGVDKLTLLTSEWR
jgi:hypothetical protein